MHVTCFANAENEKSPSMTGFLFMSSGLAGFDRGRTGRDRSDHARMPIS
jgi:hypothetical protein